MYLELSVLRAEKFYGPSLMILESIIANDFDLESEFERVRPEQLPRARHDFTFAQTRDM